jgi:ParB-like chromosome segregation protein Spo0J
MVERVLTRYAAPAMAMIDPRKLTPHERNSRVHGKAQIEDLKNSIREYGFTKPIVIDEDGVILAGHGAWLAAMEMRDAGEIDRVPTHRVKNLTEAQKRAYLIADNRLGELSKWDKDLLISELSDLDALDLDFSPRELFEKSNATKKRENLLVGGDRFLLQIEAESEPDIQALYDEMTERGYAVKILE